MKRVLVTGASGYVGLAFAEAYGTKYRLRLLSRAPSGERGTAGAFGDLASHGQAVAGDVRSLDDMVGACAGVDAVLHLAAATTDDPGATDADYFLTNTMGTFNVLEAAVRNKVRRVVYASSVCAVGFRDTPRLILETDPCDPSDGMYGVSKHLAERLCACYAERHGLSILCLRLAMVVPQHPLVSPADPDAPHWLGAVHIDDAVSALGLALDDEGTGFDILHVAADGPASKFDISRARARLGYAPRRDPRALARPGRGLLARILRRIRGLLDPR